MVIAGWVILLSIMLVVGILWAIAVSEWASEAEPIQQYDPAQAIELIRSRWRIKPLAIGSYELTMLTKSAGDGGGPVEVGEILSCQRHQADSEDGPLTIIDVRVDIPGDSPAFRRYLESGADYSHIPPGTFVPVYSDGLARELDSDVAAAAFIAYREQVGLLSARDAETLRKGTRKTVPLLSIKETGKKVGHRYEMRLVIEGNRELLGFLRHDEAMVMRRDATAPVTIDETNHIVLGPIWY